MCTFYDRRLPECLVQVCRRAIHILVPTAVQGGSEIFYSMYDRELRPRAAITEQGETLESTASCFVIVVECLGYCPSFHTNERLP